MTNTSTNTGTEWSLNDALQFIRAMQPFAWRCGYHLSLGGSVLNTGRSSNDVDLIASPLGKGTPDAEALRRSFYFVGVQLEEHRQMYDDPIWRGTYAGKMVELHIHKDPIHRKLSRGIKSLFGMGEEMPEYDEKYADRITK